MTRKEKDAARWAQRIAEALRDVPGIAALVPEVTPAGPVPVTAWIEDQHGNAWASEAACALSLGVGLHVIRRTLKGKQEHVLGRRLRCCGRG